METPKSNLDLSKFVKRILPQILRLVAVESAFILEPVSKTALFYQMKYRVFHK